MKTLKNIKYFLVCFIFIVLEMTLGKYLAVSGTVPMLSFCLCLAISTQEDNANYIIAVSVVMGVLFDLLSGHGFGPYTVTFLLSSWVTYNIRNNIFSSKIIFLIFDTLILSILFSVLYYLFNILNVGIKFWLMLKSIAAPTAFYNAIVVVIIYWRLKITIYKRR